MVLHKKSFKCILFITIIFSFVFKVNGQYFGKNKVKYKKFKFKVVESESYETYNYLENDSLKIALVKDAEKWKRRHAQVFKDTFDYKVPLIFYNNHADFQQSTVVSGLIGTSTGGITEGLKNRVILPITSSYSQTNHVLGHELVHTFQYNMIKSQDSLSFRNMANIPLWMTEGLAEYLSIGNVDSHTAMWMRDAVLHDYFPRIKDLYRSKYFPYRYGQNFWAFVGGTFGDEKIYDLYIETAKVGINEAFKRVLGMPKDSFSVKWKTTNEKYYSSLLKNKEKKPLGKKLIDAKNGGRMNISPTVSPDGKYFIFMSERNIFSMDLFLAEVATGKVKRKISTRSRDSHLDNLDGFNSAGTWSPDSKKYAFIIYSNGKNKIVITNIEKNKVVDEFFIDDLPSISSIDWSPNGEKLVLSALKNGQSNLYTIVINTKKVTQLTNDYFAQMQPEWSPDGKKIVFVTDKLSDESKPKNNLSFAILSVENNEINLPDVYLTANNLNPVFDKTSAIIYFLSDRNGYRDIYQYHIESKEIKQITNLYTGVTGITKYSPALTYSTKKDALLYSVYTDSKYEIFKLSKTEINKAKKVTNTVSNEAAVLPSLNLKNTFVTKNIKRENILVDITKLKQKKYKPKFKLDYISNGSVGVSSGRYGTGLAGGINMLFGDMLNDNQLFAGVVLNGELQDFGAQAAYINRKSRYNWGGGISHIPYRYVTSEIDYNDTVIINDQVVPSIRQTYNVLRIFNDQASAFAFYPFSKNTRIEGSSAFNYYSFRLDKINNYYNTTGQIYYGQDQERDLPTDESITFQDFNVAFVGDKSVFGLTAPMNGYRYRLEASQSLGNLNITSVNLDYRKYQYLKPITLAFKFNHFSKYGKDADNKFSNPIYLGYESIIRGYNFRAFNRSDAIDPDILQQSDIIGSKMLVSSFEIRFPFTGPERLAVIKSGVFFTDLNLFFDAGVTWGENERYEIDRSLKDSKIITSTGVSFRINLLGQLILEPYYGFPLQLEGNKKGVFGLNFIPGW